MPSLAADSLYFPSSGGQNNRFPSFRLRPRLGFDSGSAHPEHYYSSPGGPPLPWPVEGRRGLGSRRPYGVQSGARVCLSRTGVFEIGTVRPEAGLTVPKMESNVLYGPFQKIQHYTHGINCHLHPCFKHERTPLSSWAYTSRKFGKSKSKFKHTFSARTAPSQVTAAAASNSQYDISVFLTSGLTVFRGFSGGHGGRV